MHLRNTLICTVGTSLWSNLGSLQDEGQSNELKRAFDDRNWEKLVQELLRRAPDECVCGAEINTIAELEKKKLYPIERLHLLVSVQKMANRLERF